VKPTVKKVHMMQGSSQWSNVLLLLRFQ